MTSDSSNPIIIRVTSRLDVGNLAADILRRERSHAVVCVTMPSWASEPFLDTAALAVALAGAGRIYVMPTGDLSWDLTDRLPPRLDVYGGATRVWWPDPGAEPDPSEHPLFFIRDRSESPDLIEQIVSAFEQRGLLSRDRPAEGSEYAAVVTAVRPWGADLKLASGERAVVHKAQLTRASSLPPERVVRAGQSVRVAITTGTTTDGRLPVSLRPFEPEPLQRLVDEYREGDLVEGIVDELRNYGAFITLLPGYRGLVHRSQISREWVSHPEDFLDLGEHIVVRIVKIDAASEKVELSLLGIPEDAEVEPPVSIYPDGPPWLPPILLDDEAAAEPIVVEPIGSPTAGDEAVEALDSVEEPTDLEEQNDTGVAAPRTDVPELLDLDSTDSDARPELELLEQAIEDGRELLGHVGSMFASADQRIRQLRAEAWQVRQGLERDLAEARLRLLQFAEGDIAELSGSTEAALAEARQKADDLTDRLRAAEEDRLDLLARVKVERERAADAEHRATRLRKELQTERKESGSLRGQLDTLESDPERRFVAEVRSLWDLTASPDDKERYPWREPHIGPEFLESLISVQGISRERVTNVCAHMISRRAAAIAGLELHPLRTSEGGGAPQIVRADGGKAWRCSLQASTPAARRLHYWELPDGTIELGKIVYHDDFSIS